MATCPDNYCDTSDTNCTGFNLDDNCLMDSTAAQALEIAGADIHVFKLLGLHSQGKLTDTTGRGEAISSGDQPSYPASNVFDLKTCGEWRSLARGDKVTQEAFIGYNYGEIKLPNGRNQYGITTYVQHHITMIKLQQGEHPENRATKIRVEYSVDGSIWRGADVLSVPSTPEVVTLQVKQTVRAKFWRLRPLAFAGGVKDYWVVRALHFIDFASTRIDNIQDDWGLLENRDRRYAQESLTLKAYYEMVDVQGFLARFGIETTDEFTFKFHFGATVAALGRPLVIGDIFEIPSQVQYDVELNPVKKYMEVTSIAWDVNGFTPGWKPIFVKVVAAPMLAKQETMDIVGHFAGEVDTTGLLSLDESKYSPLARVLNEKTDAKSREIVPELGEDMAHKPVLPEKIVDAADQLGVNVHKLNSPTTPSAYVKDAMPPGGAPYTQDSKFPTNPKDGDWHRMTYPDAPDFIPIRLYRFSLAKNRWKLMEEDERGQHHVQNTRIAQFLNSSRRQNINEVK